MTGVTALAFSTISCLAFFFGLAAGLAMAIPIANGGNWKLCRTNSRVREVIEMSPVDEETDMLSD